MQGLPIQQLTKQAQVSAKGTAAVDSAKAGEVVVNGKGQAAGESKEAKGDFASLFAKLTGKSESEGKPSQVKSENGETLKNLLKEKESEGVEVEDKVSLLQHAVSKDGKTVKGEAGKTENGVKAEGTNLKISGETEHKIAKTNNNLDQLLNTLKGTQDNQESGSEQIDPEMRKQIPGQNGKGELKSETPLDFLMKGAKSKGVGEVGVEVEKSSQSEEAPKKLISASGEEFLKNKDAAKAQQPKLAVLSNKQEEAPVLPMQKMNVGSYGKGHNVLNDSLIRNTKDLAFKDTKKSKAGADAIESLRTPDSKVGAELSTLRQEAIGPVNGKQNQQQNLQAQTNQKVLDLSHLNTSNTTEIIKKISDYVEQNNVANKSSLELNVKHESLGEFKILATKVPESMNRGLNQIDMQITTSSKEGHDFFVKNEVSLMKNLNQAGINLSDLRIVNTMSESTAFGQSDSKQQSSFSQSQDGSSKQSFESFTSSHFSDGKERRKELWDEYQQRYGA